MKTPTKVPTSFSVSNSLTKSPRMTTSANDLSNYLETSRDFTENIDPNTTAKSKKEVRLNPNLVTSPLGSVSHSPSLNVTPDSRRRLQNFNLRNIPQQKSHHDSPVLVEKVKKLDSIVPRRRSVSSSSTLDDSRSQTDGKIVRAESIEAVAVSTLDPNQNLTPEAQLRVLNYEYRGPLPGKHHCQRSLFHATAQADKSPPQSETPKKSRAVTFKKPSSGTPAKYQAEVEKKVSELKTEKEKLMNDVHTLKNQLETETRYRQKVETQLQKSKKDSEVERQLYTKEASELHKRHQKEMNSLSKEKEKEFKNLLNNELKSMKTDLKAKSKAVEDYCKKLTEAESLAEEYRRNLIVMQQELSSYRNSESELEEMGEVVRELEYRLGIMKNEVESERKLHEDEIRELRKQREEEMEFLSIEKENEFKSRLEEQVESIRAEFDEKLRVAYEEFENNERILESPEWESELESMRNELETERKKYLNQIEELHQKHEEEMRLLSLEKENEYKNLLDEELKSVKNQFETDLKAVREEFEKGAEDGVLHRQELKYQLENMQDELDTERQKYLNEIEELNCTHKEEMELVSVKKENEYKTRLDEELELMKNQYDTKLKTVYEELEKNGHDGLVRSQELESQLQNMKNELDNERQKHVNEMEELREKYRNDMELLFAEKENEYKVQLSEQLELLKMEFDMRLKSKYEEFEKKEQDRILQYQELESELQNVKDQLKVDHQKYLNEIKELCRKHQEEMNALSQEKEKEYKTLLDKEVKSMKTDFDSKLKFKYEELGRNGGNGLLRCQELESEVQLLRDQLEVECQKHSREMEDLHQQHEEEMEFLSLDKENEFETRLNNELTAYRASQERLDELCRDLEGKLNEANQTIATLRENDNSDGEDSGFGSNAHTPRKEEPGTPEVEEVSNESWNVSIAVVFLSLLMLLLAVIMMCCTSIDGRIYIPFGFSFYPRLEYVRTPPM